MMDIHTAITHPLGSANLAERFTITPVGLEIHGDVPYDIWERFGNEVLLRAGSAVQWAIGDWLIYGEGRYGEDYAQAINDTHLSIKTLQNIVYVVCVFRFSRLRENLSFSHHAEVAAFDDGAS